MSKIPSLKFKIKNVEFEYVGDQQDIIDFINGFLYRSIEFPDQAKPVTPSVSPSAPSIEMEKEAEEIIDEPARQDEEIFDYILSKRDFNHNLFEIQKRFYGRTFASRGNTKRMYHRTARQLRLIRKRIEKEYGGKFTEEIGEKGMKRFRFKKQSSLSLDAIRKETT